MKVIRTSGFTLVECLVALSILAIALIAVLKAGGNMNMQQAELVRRMEAQWSIENTANLLRLAHAFPLPGSQRSPCSQGRAPLICTIEVTKTPNPNFRRIELRVTEASDAQDDNRYLARITLFIARVP
jgi:general secretion pathway protein I